MDIGREVDFQPSESTPKTFGRPVELKKADISRLRSLGSSLVKGGIQGANDLFNIVTRGVPLAGEYVTKKRKELEEKLPSYPNFAENVLERGSRLATSGGGLKGFVGGLFGEAVKEFGGGEFAQTVGEIAGLGAPALGKKIIPTKRQEKLVDLGRRAGLTEKQLAPLIPSHKKVGFFRKIASKGEKTQQALQETRQGLRQVYDFVESGPMSNVHLNPQQTQTFLNESSRIAKQLPFEIRKQVLEDAKDLVSGGFSMKNLSNFYHDLSSKYKLGREQLELLKQPILEAMESASPQFASDFKLANELYKRQIKIRKALKPGQFEGIIELGEIGKLVQPFLNLSIKSLSEALGIAGARRFAREALINPRLQNIQMQMVKAVNDKKYAIAVNLARYLQNKYRDESESNQTEDMGQEQ